MESNQPQKNQEIEGLPDGQPPPPRRFRIIKLEDRIAPKKGGKLTKHKTCDCELVSDCAGDGTCFW